MSKLFVVKTAHRMEMFDATKIAYACSGDGETFVQGDGIEPHYLRGVPFELFCQLWKDALGNAVPMVETVAPVTSGRMRCITCGGEACDCIPY
jgi:hypothetical protein